MADRGLVGSMAEAGRIGSASGYRLVFAFVALILVGALVPLWRARARRPVGCAGAAGATRSTIDTGSAPR